MAANIDLAAGKINIREVFSFDEIPRLFCLVLLAVALISGRLAAAPEPDSHHLTKADVDRWMKELSNWGRWGKEDEKGAINLITPQTRLAAARLIREGVSVSLAHNEENWVGPDNPHPFQNVVTVGGVGLNESISVSFHGGSHTHMDSLCHFAYGDKIYNGFPFPQLTPQGAARCSVINFKEGLFGRAVLMDMARLKGVGYLQPGEAIYPEDLDAWEARAHVRVGRGDFVLIRTGRWAGRAALGPSREPRIAGLYASCARWLKARDIAVLGSDSDSDVMPSRVEGVHQPIHQLMLAAMGVVILDNLNLEEVGRAAAARQRWDFALTVAPLAVPGGTGSPVNPIAMF